MLHVVVYCNVLSVLYSLMVAYLGVASWLSRVLCFVTFPNVSWSTSESWMMLATINWLKPFSKIFLLTVPRQYFFCGSFVFLLSCVSHAFVSVNCCLLVTCWEGLTSWLLFVMFIVFLLLSHVISWARCTPGVGFRTESVPYFYK